MSGTKDDADSFPSDVPLPEVDDDTTHTKGGAPTDKAHEDVGDGSTTGSVPAGLTLAEMDEIAKEGNGNEGGVG